MRLLLDMDGPCAHIMPTWLDTLAERHGEMLRPEQVDRWEFHEQCTHASPQQVYAVLKEPGFFKLLPPTEGAIEGVRDLHHLGCDITFFSSCSYGQSDKLEWLNEHFGFLDLDHTIFTADKPRLLSRALVQGDVYIDDHVVNLKAFKDGNSRGTAICFAQPGNRHYNGQHGVRLQAWTGIISFLKAL